jgi:hypothetical protein
MVMILLIFARRIFEVLMLYIAAPFFVAAIPLDDGAKFKLWREAFIAKSLSGFSALFTLKIVILTLPLFWSSDIQIIPNHTYDSILKMIITVAGLFTAYKSQTLISNIIDINMAASEKETSSFVSNYTFSPAINKIHPTNIRNKIGKVRREGKAWSKAFKNTTAERVVKRDIGRENKVHNAVNQYKKNFDAMRPGLQQLKSELQEETNYKTESLDDFLKRGPQGDPEKQQHQQSFTQKQELSKTQSEPQHEQKFDSVSKNNFKETPKNEPDKETPKAVEKEPEYPESESLEDFLKNN